MGLAAAFSTDGSLLASLSSSLEAGFFAGFFPISASATAEGCMLPLDDGPSGCGFRPPLWGQELRLPTGFPVAARQAASFSSMDGMPRTGEGGARVRVVGAVPLIFSQLTTGTDVTASSTLTLDPFHCPSLENFTRQ